MNLIFIDHIEGHAPCILVIIEPQEGLVFVIEEQFGYIFTNCSSNLFLDGLV